MKRSVLASLAVLFLVPTLLWSQQPSQNNDNFEDAMKKLAQDVAKSYVAPITSGFGMNLNSGWFHRAPWAEMIGFDFEFGVVGMATVFDDSHKSFTSGGQFSFDYDQADFLAAQAVGSQTQYQADVRNAIMAQTFQVSFTGPTVVGSKNDSVRIHFPGKSINVNFSGGGSQNFNLPSETFALGVTGVLEDMKALPLVAPQITLGTFLGSQFTFRYLPDVKIDDQIGSLKYFGFGVQHNPLVWFDAGLPFEVSLGYFTQDLKVGSIMEAKASSFGINSSIRLGWGFLNLTPYVGYMIEKSDLTFKYTYTITGPANQPVDQSIDFTLSGENTSRFVVGASIKILIINVNADMNFGKYKAISLGAMIII